MPCKDVPVMTILKEWRSMATGVRGRKPHHPAEKVIYEYQKNRVEKQGGASCLTADD